ncbi:MAG: PIN domain-containing protein [Nitrospiraceae bacterium]|nr:PIN domain-containing protein [Nitrospiraceae bacterium]
MYLIDSSVWVALFLEFDSNHKKAEEIIPKLEGKIYLPYNVIVEVTSVLTYKHSKKQADNFLDYIEDNKDIVLFENELKPEIEFFKKIDKKISFVDISLIFLSKKLDLNLITFDSQMISLAKKFL